MKKIIYTLSLSLLTSVTFAQMTKDEIKVVSKQMKSQSPEQFVQTAKDLVAAKSQVVELEDQLETVSAQKTMLDSEVKDYMAVTQAAKMRIEELETKRHKLATAGAGQKPTPIKGDSKVGNYDEKTSTEKTDTYGSYNKKTAVSGLVYKVQVGAFKNYNITKYFNRHDNFSGTVDEDGTMRYTLGAFSDYWEADKFKSYLRNMGVNGAWLVAYKDNKRVSMKAARGGSL